MADCVREITAKQPCKYGEHGLFEHFARLVSINILDVDFSLHTVYILYVCKIMNSSHPPPPSLSKYGEHGLFEHLLALFH